MVETSKSFFEPFVGKSADLPTVESVVGSASIHVEDLKAMMRDKLELENVLQYIQDEINKSRKVSSSVPHKGSIDEINESFHLMVEFWKEYEQGPRQVGVEMLERFQSKYENDSGYKNLYRQAFQDAMEGIVGDINDPTLRLQVEKELNAKFKYHHVSKSASLARMLTENETTYRKICVENATKRILIKMKALGKKENVELKQTAEAAIALLSSIHAESPALVELSGLLNG